jgi:hypothetical protein
MKALVEKGFRQLFGIEVKMINRSDIDIAIYVMNKKLSRLTDKKLAELEPNFSINSIGKGFDTWNYKIIIFDSERESFSTSESLNTYNSAEKAFVGLMKEWFGSELLMKFMQRNMK